MMKVVVTHMKLQKFFFISYTTPKSVRLVPVERDSRHKHGSAHLRENAFEDGILNIVTTKAINLMVAAGTHK